MRRLSTVLALAVALPVAHLYAQDLMIPASEITSYVRFLELQGKATGSPLVYWSSSTTPRAHGLTVDSAHIWSKRYSLAATVDMSPHAEFRFLDENVNVVYNSTMPRTANDGALWAGKGLSTIISAGGELRWGHFTARLYPSVVYAQNQAFTLAVGPGNTASPYAYPWHAGIDFPQRFGTSSLSSLDWGQSAIRYDRDWFTAGVSTENLWWGPAYRNPIIMSSAAPGFPHADLGTGRPVRTPIGDFELRWIWGILTRSSYSADSGDTRRVFNGGTIGYRPSFLPGLSLGFTRVLYQEWPHDGWDAAEFLGLFSQFTNAGHTDKYGEPINDYDDQLASMTARWLLPESGFEVYLEYAREDFPLSVRALVLQPDHSRAYTAGFQKTLPSPTGSYVLRGENTVLGQTGTYSIAALGGSSSPGYYTHGMVVEGYTNRGQLLGAPIGPGSNSQYLGLDHYTASGRTGIFVERIRYDDDYAFSSLQNVPNAELSQQVDLTLGLSLLRFSGTYDIGASMELTRRLNQYFVINNDVTNLKLSFSLTRRQTTSRNSSDR